MLAGLLITAGMSFWVFRVAPVTFEATANVALIPPPTAVISGDNPFLYMGGLEQAMGVLTVKMNSDSVRGPIEDAYPGAEYSTERDATTSGPIVRVKVAGDSSATTLDVLNRVLDVMPATIASLQDELSLPQASRISLLTLGVDKDTTLVGEARTRALLVVAALGLAGTLLLTGLADKKLIKRRGKKHVGAAASPPDDFPVAERELTRRSRADRVPLPLPSKSYSGTITPAEPLTDPHVPVADLRR
ncbi:hypothetical protein ASF98_22520 [Arthrobacter sp. Leaf337]|uniref:hypothetical protein n=1 Tax=Arthrobacter sp. Leaf337 TaxID=1736342 RepID=UPI0006F7D11E|nr:hypothetical protein [Arthrobacter sp. Leaf337]KQR73251.1 hypothetical protein ASF98_22520 [Arthrobacter sp. Leaf337]